VTGQWLQKASIFGVGTEAMIQKEASNECLLYFFLFWNFNKRPNPISILVLSLFLLLPSVFSRLDVFYGPSID
jgi:hypothetical protein